MYLVSLAVITIYFCSFVQLHKVYMHGVARVELSIQSPVLKDPAWVVLSVHLPTSGYLRILGGIIHTPFIQPRHPQMQKYIVMALLQKQ